MKRSNALRSLAPLLVTVGACSSILGIEELHPGPKPGSETGGDSGTGGTMGGTAAGGSSQGGKGGTAGDAGKGGATTGGASGTAGGGGDGDSGGDGGTGGGTGEGVTGHVIDFWGHALANVPVEIGTELVVTNAQGAFTIENVAPQYDVQLVVHFGLTGIEEAYGWRFEGLTRRDPTLQVWRGLESRSGYMEFTPVNAVLTGARTLTAVFGGPDGAPYSSGIGDTGFNNLLDWRGPARSSVTARALIWGVNAVSGLPTGYFAYNSRATTLDEAQPASLMLDLTDDPNIQSGNITGTVTPLTSDGRYNAAYVRFANSDGSTGAIQIVDDGNGPDSFSYLVPSLPQGSIMIAASEGDPYDGPFSLAFRDSLAPGGTANLTLPGTPIPIAPSNGSTGVDVGAQFRWSGGTGPYLLSIIDDDFFQGCFVVTARTQTNLPTFSGFALNPDQFHVWQVSVHGSHDDVDAMTGPDGYLQPLTDTGVPLGPRRGNGTYSASTAFGMTTTP